MSWSHSRITWWLLAVIGAFALGAPGLAHAAAPATISMSFQLRSTTCTKAVAQGPSGITSIAATGDVAYNICIYVEDRATGLPVDGAPVEVRTIVGTVGATGTARYSGFLFTASGGTTTISYRGNGKAFGGDTAIATYGGNAAGTATIELTPPLGRFPARIAVTTPDAPSIAARSTAPGVAYVSPAQGIDLALQVQDADGRGVNGQIVLVQSEQARLVANPGFAQSTAAVCAGASAQALVLGTTGTDRMLRAGLLMPGTIDLAVCAIPDRDPREVTVVIQSISTPLPDASVRLRHVGRPAAVSAGFDGTVLAAHVTDAEGFAVADGTPVQIVVPALAGTASASCLLTRDGRVATTIALTMPDATAIVVASYQEQGVAATCDALGNRLVTTWLALASTP